MEFSNEPIMFRTHDSFFVNTKALIIHYYDVLNIPWFTYLMIIRTEPKLQEILNLKLLEHMSSEEVLFWYMETRKHFNPLHDLWLGEQTPLSDSELDTFLFYEMARPECKLFHETQYPFLTIPEALTEIIKNNFCEHIYVYTEVEDPNVTNMVHETFGKDIKILYGNLNDHLMVLPSDATYIFPRFELFDTLIETNRLNYSTVLLPFDFRYNKNEDKTSFIRDVDQLQKDYTFKFALYNTIRG